jgi:hypothetical protein
MARNQSLHRAPRLYIYQFQRSYLCEAYASPAAFELQTLSLLRRLCTVVDDPREAELFFVNARLVNTWFAFRTRHHYCKGCLGFEAELLGEMRRVGDYWDRLPHRHIVTHLECPRAGISDPIDIAYPVLWAARPTLVLCSQNSRPGQPDVARQIHLPYARSTEKVLPVLPAAKRTVDLFYAGTFAAAYPRQWMRASLRNSSTTAATSGSGSRYAAASSAAAASSSAPFSYSSGIAEFSSRTPSPGALEAAHSASRVARFVVVPPGDTPECVS